jgi:rRNA small subunit pseudouridine methyltransferase Nep1
MVMNAMNGKLRLALLESALELVPKEIWGHPAVSKNARRRGKKPGETLLDVSLHYHAMLKLRDREKRGRPDIVHVTLLNVLESPLNKEGFLEVYVHTYSNKVVFIDPSVRIPRNYNRFVGLMEQLLTRGKVPPGADKPLMHVEAMNIKELVEHLGVDGLILLSAEGEMKPLGEIVSEATNNNMLIGIGGFAHGTFREETLKTASRIYSIYKEPLTAWIVASRLIGKAEEILKILA